MALLPYLDVYVRGCMYGARAACMCSFVYWVSGICVACRDASSKEGTIAI